MKIITLYLFFAGVTAFQPFDPQFDVFWEDFKTAFKKNYSGREELIRRLIWEQRIHSVVNHNLRADFGVYNFTLGMNEYSDLNPNEFLKRFNGYKFNIPPNRNGSTWIEPENIQLPDKVDWREKGLVTPIKNQLQCGSWWVFSATGSLEGQQAKKTGHLISLSEQNLIDCSRPQGNYGCTGGSIENAFEYVKENNGIDTEDSYPFKGEEQDHCYFDPLRVGAKCTGYVNIPIGDEEALKKSVATVGPVSAAIDASPESFQLYRSGIYDEPNCSTEMLSHGVLVVGYGTENGIDYWLVKNSWGTTWGMDGYIKMSRNKRNQCGIASLASYPLV